MKNSLPKEILLMSIMVASISAQGNVQEEKIKEPLDRLEKIFQKIPAPKLLEHLVEQEKRKLLQDMLEASSENQSSEKEDKDTYFFEPKQPRVLSEKEKKINVEERIAKKYIGKLPEQVHDVIFYFENHEKCKKNNIAIYNRLLLYGEPGTGKSYLFKVLAEELQIPTLSFTASFFADKYIGESARRIRKAFESAKQLNNPVLIFIDEIDALAATRRNGMHEEHRAALITLLTELQEL